MPVDAKEALTRKLGPLPAWGWGVAIGGAILVAKLVKGGSSSTATPNAGYTPTVAGGGGMVGTGGDATPTDVFSGANSLVEQLQEQVSGQETSLENQQGLISGLTDTVHTLTDFQALQTKLIDLLKQRDAINANIAKYQNLVTKHQLLLKQCKTAACKTKENGLIKQYQSGLTKNTNALAPINQQITTTQGQLNGANQT